MPVVMAPEPRHDVDVGAAERRWICRIRERLNEPGPGNLAHLIVRAGLDVADRVVAVGVGRGGRLEHADPAVPLRST